MSTVPPDRPDPAMGPTPAPELPAAVVERFDARVLDPVRAVPAVSGAWPRPTAYVGDTLPVHGQVRATLDPDDFSGGFGSSSGTSFAAPVLAGELGWTP